MLILCAASVHIDHCKILCTICLFFFKMVFGSSRSIASGRNCPRKPHFPFASQSPSVFSSTLQSRTIPCVHIRLPLRVFKFPAYRQRTQGTIISANDSNDCGFRGVCFKLLPLPRNTAGHLSHTLFSGITIQLPARSTIFVLSTVVWRRCSLRRCEYRRHLLLTRVGLRTYICQLRAAIP